MNLIYYWKKIDKVLFLNSMPIAKFKNPQHNNSLNKISFKVGLNREKIVHQ